MNYAVSMQEQQSEGQLGSVENYAWLRETGFPFEMEI